MKHNTTTGQTENNGFTFELYSEHTALNLLSCPYTLKGRLCTRDNYKTLWGRYHVYN